MNVFVTGGTGYMGRRLIPLLVQRGHKVTALVRPGSEGRLPARNASHSDAGGPNETRRVVADPLAMNSYTESIRSCDTFVHLIGVPHPSPAKARQFREIDLVSAKVAVPSATAAGIKHFIYLSVAQPASLMKDFIAVRAQGEEMIRRSGMSATFLRPWYVLGPGHRWPYFLLPIYALLGCFPATRESARRLGLVTIKQMISALVWAVENPATGIRIVDVPQIRATCRLE
ncbi:MAG: SDR family oxidoreductase [Chthoniobacterales bacterium]